jgi:PhzF family phenazine biosynthesis protein
VEKPIDFQYSYSNQKLVVEIEDEDAIKALSPNFRGLLSVENTLGWRGVVVTSKSRDYDFVSRYFAPWMGVDEDPVTGSAHTVLAPYWSAKLGKTSMIAYQASKRGGSLHLELGDRVKMVGGCVTVVRGFLDLSF